jgi:NAD+ synthase (glutamine-hydrolysing)
MGITYEQLSTFGRLRKLSRCGPVSMFHAALRMWHGTVPVLDIAKRVQFFFRCVHSPRLSVFVTSCAVPLNR